MTILSLNWRAWVGRLILEVASLLVAGARGADNTPSPSDMRPPRLNPDYAGIMIPPNIAPLNFVVDESASRYRIKISSRQGQAIQKNAARTRTMARMLPPRAFAAMTSITRNGIDRNRSVMRISRLSRRPP